MFFPLLLTVGYTSMDRISRARSVTGLLLPVLGVDTALPQVVLYTEQLLAAIFGAPKNDVALRKSGNSFLCC